MERSNKKSLKVATNGSSASKSRDGSKARRNHEVSPLLNFNLAFDFDFGFDSENEMSGLKKKARSEDEINKCATNEDYSPLQKAIHIMKKGYEVQKKSIVSNLQIYVTPDFASNNELLPMILDSIEMWDTEFQCLLA